jgi:hypothetical protein
MKINSIVSKILTNKWVLNFVAVIAMFNMIGFMVMGNLNNILMFIVLSILVRYFSKNMIIVLGVPLIFVNLLFMNKTIEGLETATEPEEEEEEEPEEETPDTQMDPPVIPETDAPNASNIKTDEHFEVGRPKNSGSKIDYAATVESAYDELNKVLGGDGIKNLTDDTQKLMKQQMELAKSMEGLAPMVEKMMPMAQQMQGMMQSMNTSGGGMSTIMDMAKKMAGK